MRFGVGVIEGFYGRPWPPQERIDTFPFLAANGYTAYLYAPKRDRWLREGWREEPGTDWHGELQRMVQAARDADLHVGVGLSPVDAGADPAGSRRQAALKARWLAGFGLDTLALLFDDMPVPGSNAALLQADLVRAAADASGIARVLMCPSWYSDDPALEREIGPMPEHYLHELGQRLDSDIGVFWTGAAICSPRHDRDSLERVAARLGRWPVLWDNYPVNDGPTMCRHLHLRAFEGRGSEVCEMTAGIFANPMNQCALSRLPLLTLPRNMWQPDYDADRVTEAVMRELLPPSLAGRLLRDWRCFHHDGLDAIDAGRRETLAADYAGIDHPAAQEVAQWLRGQTLVVTREGAE